MSIVKLCQIVAIFMFLLEAAQAKSSGILIFDIIILYGCLVWTPFFREETRGGKK